MGGGELLYHGDVINGRKRLRRQHRFTIRRDHRNKNNLYKKEKAGKQNMSVTERGKKLPLMYLRKQKLQKYVLYQVMQK